MCAEERPREGKFFAFGFEAGIAEAEEDGKGDDAKWSQRSNQCVCVRNAGYHQAVKSRHSGEQKEPAQEIAG
jgi:hypothetical protein